MAVREKGDVFESYERALSGPKMDEQEWDRKVIPETAKKLKEKYGLKFDKGKINPTDDDVLDRLFQAGLKMLATCGVYCTETGRVIKYTEEEIMMAMAGAPREVIIGEGRDARRMAARRFDDPNPPLCQGGPTGAPVSENIFMETHEAFAREPLVDCIVDGVFDTIYGHPLKSHTPWDIAAAKAEATALREAVRRAGRPGMGF
jgi:methylamine--corrinoid protein Co-methyltransferase